MFEICSQAFLSRKSAINQDNESEREITAAATIHGYVGQQTPYNALPIDRGAVLRNFPMVYGCAVGRVNTGIYSHFSSRED